MLYIVPSRPMIRLFNGVNFGYRSVEVYRTFSSYLQVLIRIRNFYNMVDSINYTDDLPRCFRPFI